MSSYITRVGEKNFFCMDDYFWHYQYWYVELSDNETIWNIDLTNKKVLTEWEFEELKKELIT